jgi:hypothetical protein
MSRLFNRLPGFQQTPPGFEQVVLRRLPGILVRGSLLLALPSVLIRALELFWTDIESTVLISTVDIYVISFLILHWTVVFTAAIAAFIVMVMKGPAYVADAYPMDEHDPPTPTRPGRRL